MAHQITITSLLSGVVMTAYRRIYSPGAVWFFTVNLAQRHHNRLLLEYIDVLRDAFTTTQKQYPFVIDAIVILPEHLHCIWTLPENTADYSIRWRMIKAYFSRGIPKLEAISASRQRRRERAVWQRRFWAHLLTDQESYNRHVDYIHFNPVKHGWVDCVQDWPYSSFHRYVRQGIYTPLWGGEMAKLIEIDGDD